MDPGTHFENLIIQALNKHFKNSKIIRVGLFCLKRLTRSDYSKILKRREVKFDLEAFMTEYEFKTEAEAFHELGKDIFSTEILLPRFLKIDEEDIEVQE